MDITQDSKVGQIATEYPMATRVFSRHNIDFCCGGGVALESVCAKKGLEVQTILDEINSELSDNENTEVRWDQESLPALIEHILAVYHRPLDEELPRLEAMARRVVEVHGEKMPQILPQILSTYLMLKTELEQHMSKEEQILFPMILQGQGCMAEGPIEVMHEEHDNAGEALQKLRELTDNFTVPEEACNTWRALWHGLEALEDSLHKHIHLENNILFPGALSS